ncbi:MAG: DsrE family protein [Candidatus Aramenus sp.]|nr:DsrE family protein [Candidatus Aramenus sp.]
MKVVVQVSDYNSLTKAIRSVNNLRNEMPEAQIEVVFHQDAIKGLTKDSEYKDAIRELLSKGIDVMACRNSMNAFSLKEEDLLGNVKVVKSGVAEIVRKQAEGWIYLRL